MQEGKNNFQDNIFQATFFEATFLLLGKTERSKIRFN